VAEAMVGTRLDVTNLDVAPRRPAQLDACLVLAW
jgi:hypothetical protein